MHRPEPGTSGLRPLASAGRERDDAAVLETSTPREVPNRLRVVGLLTLFGSIIWVVMPFAMAMGSDLSSGIGVSISLLGSETPMTVYPAMLILLTPLSLVTSVSGVLLYYGRAVGVGLAVALVWVAIGLAASVELAVVAGFVVYCIVTGMRRMESAPDPAEG